MPIQPSTLDNIPALVTGGAGFIGSHIADALLEHGALVTVLDDLSTGSRDNVPAAATFVEGSILDEAVLDATMSQVAGGLVFHEAAMVSVPLSVEQPQACLHLNLTGTQRVLDAARRHSVRRVVFASSAAVYGDEPSLPSQETDAVDPRSPYAATKLAAEHLLQAYSASYGLSTVSLRYFNIFGSRQSPHSAYAAAIAAFSAALSDGQPPTVFGDGGQTRDFTHVANVVYANLLAATSQQRLGGEPINIGTGRQVSLLDVIEQLQAILGTDLTPRFAPARAGDVRHSRADVQRANQVLGYEPVTDLMTGLRQMLGR